MKKTLTVNLNGCVWTINEDAYQELKNYLDELENSFSSDEEKEILSDIEARISELFSERLDKKRAVVEKEDVEYIISVLGNVSDFSDNKEPEKKGKKRSKRFYRNPDNKIIGGVAGGLAAYLGWDPTVVRLLFVFLLIVGFSWFFAVYLLIWLIAPEAETFAQKLEMNGEDVTVDNIKNIKTRIVESMPEENKIKSFGQRVGEVILGILKWGVIIIGGCIGLAVASACIGVLFGLLLLGIVCLAEPAWVVGLSGGYSVLFFVSLFLLCLLPLVGCIWLLVRLLSRKPRKKNRAWVGWSMLVLWLIAFFIMIFSGIKFAASSSPSQIEETLAKYVNKDWLFDDADIVISEPRQLKDFNAIHLDNATKLELSQSNDYSVRVFGNANHITDIKTEVRDSVLYVYNNSRGKAKVEVSLPAIKSIVAESASKIESEGFIEARNLDIQLNGVSNADMKLNVENLSLHIGQASKVELEGNASKLFLRANGASKADLETLNVQDADMEIRAASYVEAYVTDTLKCDLSGASHLKYKGKPTLLCTKNDASVVICDTK